MRKWTLVVITMMALAVPALAMAQDGGGEPGGQPVLLWIVAALGVVAAVLNGATKLWPGAGTYIGIALTVVASVTVALQDLAASNPNASLAVILITAASAALGRARSDARAA